MLTRIIHEAFRLQNNPPYEPFGFAQGLELVEGQGVKHRVETCMKANSFLAGADSRILGIRE